MTRIGRNPIPAPCRKCRRIVLTAWDADMCAILVHLEPHALTPHGEVWALRDGRRTYNLTRTGIDRRDRWNIPGKPPSIDRVVLASHECSSPGVPPEHRLDRSTRRRADRPTDPNHIPF